MVPILFNVAGYKPKVDDNSKGNRFFIDNGYSHRIDKIEQIGI